MSLSSEVALETRTSVGRFAEETCTAIPRGYEQGIHTDRYRASGYRSRVVASDVRLRYEPHARWGLSGGAGWTWSHQEPYLVASLGWRGGRRLRPVLDAEVSGHRFSTRVLTREWRRFEVLEVLSERMDSEWRMGLGLRIGLEARLR